MANNNSVDNDARVPLRDVLTAAMEAHRAGDLYEADLLYREALVLEPDNLQALRLRGILARERGDLDKSLTLLQRAHAIAPADAGPLDEIALTQMAAGRLQAGEQNLRQALTLDPRSVKTLVNLGALLQHRGHLQASIDCYRRALDLDPDDLQLHCNLAKALADAGQTEEALTMITSIVENSGGHPWALAARGAVLADGRQYAEARSVLEQAGNLNPDDDMALVNLALCCYELGDTRAAAAALRRAVATNPFNARAVADLANCLTALDDTTSALQLCDEFLQQHPGERLVVAAQALALINAGQIALARALTDFDTLIKVIDVPCPLGFDGIAAFNAALARSVSREESLLEDPVSKSTRGGAQTGELDLQRAECLVAFEATVHRIVTTATADWRAAGLQNHPLMAPAADSWYLRAWGTVLRAGGRQTPHMHPLGWLSGVYYAQLPDGLAASDSGEGWLEFGRPPERFSGHALPAVKRFAPAEGRLLLFPSWFWHQTLPFQANGERISIAFDVMPQAALRLL